MKNNEQKFGRFKDLSLVQEQKEWIVNLDSKLYYEAVKKYCQNNIPWKKGKMTYTAICGEINKIRNRSLQEELDKLKRSKQFAKKNLMLNPDGEYYRAKDFNVMSDRGIKDIFEDKFDIEYDIQHRCLKKKNPELEERVTFLSAINSIFQRSLTTIEASKKRKSSPDTIEYIRMIEIQHVGIYAHTIADLVKLTFPETNFSVQINYDSLKLTKFKYLDGEMEQYNNLYACLKEMTRKLFKRYEIWNFYENTYYNKLNDDSNTDLDDQ